MLVLYDHQIFASQVFGGISRYFYELLRAQKGGAELSLAYSDNAYLRSDSKFRDSFASKAAVRRPPPWVRAFNRAGTRRRVLIERANHDRSRSSLVSGKWSVFHPTYYDPYFLGWIGARPYVLTVHDMIHELFPEHFALNDPVTLNKRKLIAGAAHIIAISETTKRDLQALYGVPSSAVTVIYHGSSLAPGRDAPLPHNLPKRYVLMVGTRLAYKNAYFALRAMSRLCADRPDLSFVFAGGGAFNAEEQAFFASLGLAERVHHFPASDALLAVLYSRAAAFVFPSLYEGFGIPIVEAFSCRCPLVASRVPAITEVAGDAAEFFDPKDPESLCAAVTRVIDDSTRCEQLRSQGQAQLTRYSWQDCVAKTIEVYKAVAG